MQERHIPSFEAAESTPVLLWSATKQFLQDILTQRKIRPNLKQIETTWTLNFSAICKTEFWDTVISYGDTDYVWKRFWTCPLEKSEMGLQGAKKQKRERERERERERAETVNNESGSISSFETLSNKGVSKCTDHGDFWKKTYSPVLVISFFVLPLET